LTPKRLYIGLLCAGLAILGLSFYFYGYENTWRLWHIPTLQPSFLDFRLIPGSAESIRAGYDPGVENPSDPLGRIFNYPRIWYIFLYTPIDLKWTTPISISIIAFFFLGVGIFPGKLDRFSIFLLLLTIFSSAVMLGVERANVDLIFFTFLALALVMIETFPPGSFSLLMLSVVFKIFPIFGAGYFLGFEKKRAYQYILSAVLFTILYFAANFQDMLHVFSATNKGDDLSYGWLVAPLYMEGRLGIPLSVTQPIFFCGLLVVLILVAVLAIRQRPAYTPTTKDPRNLRAFWIGAGIYIGTFLLGNIWDYRLMFLLFTVPQLAEWAQQKNGAFSNAARLTAVALIVSCWYLVIWEILAMLTRYGHKLAYAVDESVNWILFAGLAYLFIRTLPGWIFDDFSDLIKKLGIKKAES
jgi:hypothetical protein